MVRRCKFKSREHVRRTGINLLLGVLYRLALHKAHDSEESADDDRSSDELIQTNLEGDQYNKHFEANMVRPPCLERTYSCYGRRGLAPKGDILLQELEPDSDDGTEAERRRGSVNAQADRRISAVRTQGLPKHSFDWKIGEK